MSGAEKTGSETTAAKPGRGVVLTEKAVIELRRVMAENNLEDAWLRVGAKGGGCSGFTYVLDFDEKEPTEYDLTFVDGEVPIVIDKKSEFFIGGTVIDFNDGLLDRGFVFKNPQASGSCGCGTSFSI